MAKTDATNMLLVENFWLQRKIIFIVAFVRIESAFYSVGIQFPFEKEKKEKGFQWKNVVNKWTWEQKNVLEKPIKYLWSLQLNSF